MKIIISPAKKMKEEEGIQPKSEPVFLKQANSLRNRISTMEYQELKRLLGCNEKLATLNYERYQRMDPEGKRGAVAALTAYEGLQYQYMAAQVFSQEQWDYVSGHLRILSGFYGILKPLDGILPYRLEMQAALEVEGRRNLYEFWGRMLYEELAAQDSVILNLASKEYSRVMEQFLQEPVRLITCQFGYLTEQGEVKVKGTLAKMARGEMVRWLSMNQIHQIEDVKRFEGLGYRYFEKYSSEQEYVFLPDPGKPAEKVRGKRP